MPINLEDDDVDIEDEILDEEDILAAKAIKAAEGEGWEDEDEGEELDPEMDKLAKEVIKAMTSDGDDDLDQNPERHLGDYDFCGHHVCTAGSWYVCYFFCKGWKRRNLRTNKQRNLSNQEDLCTTHTNIKMFLHEFPTNSIDECINDDTLCQLVHPCSI